MKKLIPEKNPNAISCEEFEECIPNEGKWEYYGKHYFDEDGTGERQLLLALLAKVGLRDTLNMLPKESLNDIRDILKELS